MSAGRRAFSLVELFVVIAVVAVLLGLLLPGLGRARDEARAVRSAVASRSLVSAWTLYAEDHRGELLPGYLPITTDVRVTDEYGNEWGALIAQRWVYRLAPWFDHAMLGTTIVGEEAEFARDSARIRGMENGHFEWAYRMSVYPSFGLNVQHVGGNYADPPQTFRATNPLRRLDQPLRPGHLVVFASARGPGSGDTVIPGFHRVEPPPRGAVFSPAAKPQEFGHLDARYNRRVVAALADGHAERIAPGDLTDRRRWSDVAARKDDPDWEP